MAYVFYIARRGVVSYHAVDTSYNLDFKTSAITRPDGGDIKVAQESLNGSKETQFYGERRIWGITTIPYQVNSAQAGLLIEFLRSTADGQTFTLDPYGFGGASVSAMNVTREDQGYTENPFKEIDGVGDYVTFSFSVRES